jgi:hemerythrin-like domain-containing protein
VEVNQAEEQRVKVEEGLPGEIMSELEATPVDDETWAAKLTVMKENLEHHIEEEEGEMFPQARQVMEPGELNELAERMATRKEELEASLSEKAERALGKLMGKAGDR